MPSGSGAAVGLRPAAFVSLLLAAALIGPASASSGQPGGPASPGPLSRAHAPLEGPAQCQKCHDPDRQVIAARCLSCHAPIAQRIARKRGVHRDVTDQCALCHVEHGGVDAELRPIDTRQFDHASETGFPLDGRHAALKEDCAACHKTRSFIQNVPACASCHADAHRGTLGESCATCHTPEDWRRASQAFHKVTVFPLEGRHRAVPCASCHLKGQTKGTPTRCYDCHWVRRQDDKYATRLGNQCEQCHRPTSWTAVNWDHGSRTGMALNVAHRLQACDSCHKERTFAGSRPQCLSCHEKDYRATRSPNHAAAGFPLACDVCHKPSAPTFAGATLDHSGFARVGAHATAQCDSCHRNNVYKGTPRDCVGCHQADYQRAANPNHAAAGFPTTCDSCHRPADRSFAGATFSHAQYYPLQGAHTTQACAACHRNNVYKGTPRDCVGCHQADYQRAANPNHAAAGFPTTCESCHRPADRSFAGATFSHAQYYPLQGAHTTQACATCHRNNVYKGTPRDCVGCHQADYQRAANPNHAAAGFPTTCDSCHRVTDGRWQGASFTHSQTYALSGSHATAACSSCHKNNVYRGTPRDCVGCHRTQYDQTRSPNHAAAGFTTACESCHRPGGPGWTGATINHSQFYPLLGRHSTANCASCHRTSLYKGTPRECYPCHQPDYQRAVNPNHATAGFPTACESCHRSGGPGWAGASFNHSQFFALQGVHATPPCASCHRNNVYKGTPRECAGCHQARYDGTRNPNHRAAGFPTTCDTCHRATDSAWTQGRFNHTWFPITSGRHANRACSECHQDSNNYRSFTCLTCHSRSETDKDHQGKSGYRYDSAACYSCHPQGRS